MPLMSLSEACSLITDGTHYTPPDVGAGMSFLTVKDIQKDGSLDFEGCSKISPDEYQKAVAGNSAPRLGDVLFSKDGTVGKVSVVRDDRQFAVLSSIAILRPNLGLIDSEYLGHVLRSEGVLDQALKKKTGSAIRRIILSDLKGVRFFVPTIPEQRRIAAILDKADALRAKRREAIAKLNRLLQSVFLDMFGDPISNPKGWQIVRVGDVFSDFIGGKNVECPDESASCYRILKVSAVTSKFYQPYESKPAPDGFIPVSDAVVRKGDLLFSRANTTDLVAATAFVWETPDNIVLPDKIWKMRVSNDVDAKVLFLWELFKNSSFRNEISKRSSGTSGSMKNISKAKLRLVPMPMPPIEVQQNFSDISERIHAQLRSLSNAGVQSEDLFSAIQRQAFSCQI